MAALNGVKTLDMVGGEITKVAYNGAEYVRVDGNANKGDLVLCTGQSSFFSKNAFYLAFDTYNGKEPRMVDNVGDPYGIHSGDYVLFRKVSAEITPTVDKRVDALEKRVDALEEKPTFKEGDIVVITGKGDIGDFSTHRFAIGELVRVDIATKNTSHSDRFAGESLKDGGYWYVHESYARHATQAERQAYEESLKPKPAPKLKAGDYVKFAEDFHDITAGKAYKVVVDSSDGELVVIDDGGDKNDVIHNEPYETVEPTPFTRAGRKEGEFKVGDVVRVTGSCAGHPVGTIGVLEYDNFWCVLRVRANGELKSHLGQMELIAPVESRVDGSERPCA